MDRIGKLRGTPLLARWFDSTPWPMKAPQRIAVHMATLSGSRFKVGCVIAKGKRILSAGYNQMCVTHPLMGTVKKLHAEVHALCSAHIDLNGTTAYVARILANGNCAMARPCPICLKELARRGVARVVYTYDLGWKEENIKNTP